MYMKYKLNVCDFCCGLFSKCEDVCPLPSCPLVEKMELYWEAENRFGDFLEFHSNFIKKEMLKGVVKPGEEIEVEYHITNVQSDSVN